jgi:predicted nucleic acid-binding protein
VERGLMFLLDTCIWLELLLNQEKAESVRKFLEETETSKLFLSDFALHSIGIVTLRLEKPELYKKFIADLVVEAGVNIISLKAEEMYDVLEAASNFKLDFDDAYQYVSARNSNLELLSFDTDFERTDIKRKEI